MLEFYCNIFLSFSKFTILGLDPIKTLLLLKSTILELLLFIKYLTYIFFYFTDFSWLPISELSLFLYAFSNFDFWFCNYLFRFTYIDFWISSSFWMIPTGSCWYLPFYLKVWDPKIKLSLISFIFSIGFSFTFLNFLLSKEFIIFFSFVVITERSVLIVLSSNTMLLLNYLFDFLNISNVLIFF